MRTWVGRCSWGDKSGDTLCQAFRSWHTAVKSTAAIHGGLKIARFDYGNKITKADFRKLPTELGVAVEYTPVDGAKRNGRVERKLALIAEGARAAWLEFPRHFPDLEFPAKANSWHQIWPEAFTWMNDCLNTAAQAHTPDKLSPYEMRYKKRPTNRLLPFMMPGFRHHNRKNKAESKGERCFFLNYGNNHSSTTDKILLPSGIASYSADVTWGYRRRPFVGMMPGAPAAAGTRGAATSAPAVAGSIGGSVFCAASAGMMAGALAAAGTRGVATSAPAVADRIGGSVFPATLAGMMAGALTAAGTRVAATSAPAVAGSIGGSVFPAASAGIMDGAPAAAGTRGVVTSAQAVAGSIGGCVFPAASAGIMAGAPAAAGTRGVATSAPAVAGSIGGNVFPAASAGMMADAPAAAGTRGATTSAPAVTGSIGGSVFHAASARIMAGAPAATGTRGSATSAPAVADGIDGSVFPTESAGMMLGAPATTGSKGAAASAPAVAGGFGGNVFPAESPGMMAGAPADAESRGAAPLVANGSGGNAFPAESAGMMAGAPAAAGSSGAALQAASSAVRPPPAVTFASDDHEDCQVRRTATATRRQAYEVTPAMTRSRSRSSSRHDGVSGAFAALTTGEDTVRTLDDDDGELPAGPAHLLVTPETYAQAHAGPHSRIWTEAESKEFEGLSAVGTFVEEVCSGCVRDTLGGKWYGVQGGCGACGRHIFCRPEKYV